jgi:hypothetical protein
MSAAAESGPDPAARISVVASIGYFANLAGPPAIGALAASAGLLQSLWLFAALFVAAFAAAGSFATTPGAVRDPREAVPSPLGGGKDHTDSGGTRQGSAAPGSSDEGRERDPRLRADEPKDKVGGHRDFTVSGRQFIERGVEVKAARVGHDPQLWPGER